MIVKFHRRNLPDRFEREVSPRANPAIQPFAPTFLGTSVDVKSTPRNHCFQGEDHRLFIEAFVPGKDLRELYEEEPILRYVSAGIAVARYRALGRITQTLGWTLSNMHPGNIRFSRYDDKKALIVDWGGQTEGVDMQKYTDLIDRTIYGPFLKQ